MKRVGGLGRFLRAHGSHKNILVVSGRENVECHASGLHVVLPAPPWLLELGWEGESEFLRTREWNLN